MHLPPICILRRLRLFIGLLALWLAACAGPFGPKTITLGERELARLIEKQFPFERRIFDVIDVRVATPRVTLLPESNRVATELDIATHERLFGRSQRGQIAMDYGLRYDETEQAVRLNDVRVNRLTLDGLSAQGQSIGNRLGSVLAEAMLNDMILYRFKPEDLNKAEGRGYRPGAVTVTARGVEITLVPITR